VSSGDHRSRWIHDEMRERIVRIALTRFHGRTITSPHGDLTPHYMEAIVEIRRACIGPKPNSPMGFLGEVFSHGHSGRQVKVH
jgi:hypothetical protein